MAGTDTDTLDLLARLRSGDDGAGERIVEQVLTPLTRFTRRRLPQWARGASDTQDLVHDVVLRALPRLRTFEAHGPGALQAFLRKAVVNRVVDEIRSAQRRGCSNELPESLPDPAQSPLDRVISVQSYDRYRSALATLSAADQALITERMHKQCSYAEIAAVFGKPNANAARVAVARALGRLAAAVTRRTAAARPSGSVEE